MQNNDGIYRTVYCASCNGQGREYDSYNSIWRVCLSCEGKGFEKIWISEEQLKWEKEELKRKSIEYEKSAPRRQSTPRRLSTQRVSFFMTTAFMGAVVGFVGGAIIGFFIGIHEYNFGSGGPPAMVFGVLFSIALKCSFVVALLFGTFGAISSD